MSLDSPRPSSHPLLWPWLRQQLGLVGSLPHLSTAAAALLLLPPLLLPSICCCCLHLASHLCSPPSTASPPHPPAPPPSTCPPPSPSLSHPLPAPPLNFVYLHLLLHNRISDKEKIIRRGGCTWSLIAHLVCCRFKERRKAPEMEVGVVLELLRREVASCLCLSPSPPPAQRKHRCQELQMSSPSRTRCGSSPDNSRLQIKDFAA